jgi:hypothetical protein
MSPDRAGMNIAAYVFGSHIGDLIMALPAGPAQFSKGPNCDKAPLLT